MTMQFSSSITQLFLGKGVLNQFNPGQSQGNNWQPPFGVCITLYSGTQPAAADVVNNWVTYNSSNSNFLAHFQGGGWYWLAIGVLQLVTPPAVLASGTGTATWAILWPQGNPGSMTLDTLGTNAPPNPAFMVVPVTDTNGNGIIRMLSTSIISGSSVSIVDGSISAS